MKKFLRILKEYLLMVIAMPILILISIGVFALSIHWKIRYKESFIEHMINYLETLKTLFALEFSYIKTGKHEDINCDEVFYF